MDELTYVYISAAIIVSYFVLKLLRKAFDPFAPVWLFLTGYVQVYIVQAISYHDYAIRVRGVDVTTLANTRSLWALIVFLLAYEFGPGRGVASKLPRAPMRWSLGIVGMICPILFVWGIICGLAIASTVATHEMIEVSPESLILLQFPIYTLVAAILLIVSGRNSAHPRPALTVLGLCVSAIYIGLFMFNGKRSHSLLGVLSTVCAFYTPKLKRPSFPVLGLTALVGVMAVGIAIGWRVDRTHQRDPMGFIEFLADFDPSKVLASLNIDLEGEEGAVKAKHASKETEEYGGYLLMLSTVPALSDYDYGASYIRIVSTFIPRLIWADKPFFGREAWAAAWVAGSEFKRKSNFTGPAIGILGATQLNGGAPATFIVMIVVGVFIRSGYEYFLRYSTSPWAQVWWALTFYNAWFMTVNDDPFVWFYYAYGFMVFPPLAFLWLYNRLSGGNAESPAVAPFSYHPMPA